MHSDFVARPTRHSAKLDARSSVGAGAIPLGLFVSQALLQERHVRGVCQVKPFLRRNPNRPASVRTVENYRQCLTRVARDLEAEGLELRELTPETAVKCLEDHAHFGQKHLDMHRQAIQAVLVHVTCRLPKRARLPLGGPSGASVACLERLTDEQRHAGLEVYSG